MENVKIYRSVLLTMRLESTDIFRNNLGQSKTFYQPRNRNI